MGWWQQDVAGNSFADNVPNPEYLWGDGPADIVDDALDKIKREFHESVERKPFLGELLAGFLFSMGALDRDVQDDGYAAIIVKRDALAALRRAWQDGDADKGVIACVRDLFDGEDGDLQLIASNRFMQEDQ